MSSAILDASAVLALVNGESGSDVVAAELPDAIVSAINLSEVVAKLAEAGLSRTEIHDALDGLGFTIKPFDEDAAYAAGLLRVQTKPMGLSLGDRACLSLGLQLGLPVLTADRLWTTLEIGIDVRAIR